MIEIRTRTTELVYDPITFQPKRAFVAEYNAEALYHRIVEGFSEEQVLEDLIESVKIAIEAEIRKQEWKQPSVEDTSSDNK